MKLQRAGIEVSPAVVAPLDPDFLPAVLFNRKYRELVSAISGVPLKLALERGDGSTSTYCTQVCPPGSSLWPATATYVERIVKFLLWQRGGWRVYVGGPIAIGEHIKAAYSPTGARSFDAGFMGGVYERPFEVVVAQPEDVPEAREMTVPRPESISTTASAWPRYTVACRLGISRKRSRRCSCASAGNCACRSRW